MVFVGAGQLVLHHLLENADERGHQVLAQLGFTGCHLCQGVQTGAHHCGVLKNKRRELDEAIIKILGYL